MSSGAGSPRISRVEAIRSRPGNEQCADCSHCDCELCQRGGSHEPVFASPDLGVLVCAECKALHDLVTKTSFKDLRQQDEPWTDEEWKRLEDTSNADENAIYEAKVPAGYKKPTRCFHKAFRVYWLTSKYIKGHFSSLERRASSVDRSVKLTHTSSTKAALPGYLKFGEKTGYLWKRGRDDDMFQKRWFEISIGQTKAASLTYYTDVNKQNLRGEINLENVHVCVASEEKIRKPNGLQLIIEEERQIRMIYLYAEKEKDMVEWYQAICIMKFWVARHAALDAKKHFNAEEVLHNLNQEILMEGALLKTDPSGKKPFKRRWFILHGKHLMYFANELAANPLKTVRLGSYRDGYSIIVSGEYHPNWPKGGFHFFLKTPGRPYTLLAESEEERRSWYLAIFRACNPGKPKPAARQTSDKLPLLPSPSDQSAPPATVTSPRKSSITPVPTRDPPSPVPPSLRRPSPVPLPLFPGIGNGTATGSDTAPESPMTDDEGHYLMPTRSSPDAPIVPPRPPETLPPCPAQAPLPKLPNIAPSVSSSDESGTEEEPAYVTATETVPVICSRVDSMGACVKGHGFCLRIPPGALDQSRSDKCFVSVTPRWTVAPPEAMASDEQTGLNAHAALVVECRSFNYEKPLRKPMQLEIPHCAIIGDVRQCRVKLWHKAIAPKHATESPQWREVLDNNASLSYRVKQNCMVITTLHLGTYAFLLDGPGVLGKAMQMATFLREQTDQSMVSANVYIFNNISSDLMWTRIEEQEMNDGSVLSDITTSFSIQRGNVGIRLEIQELDGLQLPEGQDYALDITSQELHQSPFLKFSLNFGITGPQGTAKIVFCQDAANDDIGTQEENLLSYMADEHGMYADISMIRSSLDRPSGALTHGSAPTPPAANPDYLQLDFYPPPSRHTSDRRDAQRKQSLRQQRFARSILRGRYTPQSRTVPRAPCRTRDSTTNPPGKASSSTTTTETSETSSEGGSTARAPGCSIPQGLKHDLSELLDWAELGNDWSMLARYVGLEHLMYRFVVSPSPTVEFLNCCEQYSISLSYLAQATGDIDREDAATLIRSYLMTSGLADTNANSTNSLPVSDT